MLHNGSGDFEAGTVQGLAHPIFTTIHEKGKLLVGSAVAKILIPDGVCLLIKRGTGTLQNQMETLPIGCNRARCGARVRYAVKWGEQLFVLCVGVKQLRFGHFGTSGSYAQVPANLVDCHLLHPAAERRTIAVVIPQLAQHQK
jgi:hypothetical protein